MQKVKNLPIKYWSHSSLMSFLRNPLAWHKRYVEKIYDTPSTPASIVGRAGHIALQHYYGGIKEEGAIALGLEYLTSVPDFEINFGRFKTKREQKNKRLHMEREYLQAIGFYLDHAPRYNVLGIEVSAIAHPKGLALPIKAISDLVVKSRKQKGALDIVDHKFVDSFSAAGAQKTLFVIQAMFNYFTVQEQYKKPVRRFILHECKKRKNADESKQMRRYVIDYTEHAEEFKLFQRLINDATKEIARRRIYLPNPSDMFEGEDSVAVYKMGLVD